MAANTTHSNNTLQTRIRLKYDSYANWQAKKSLVLLAGEIGICAIPSGSTAVDGDLKRPQVMFKVGDGTSTWENLPWASAKAADVYDWAKAEYATTYRINEVDGVYSLQFSIDDGASWADMANSQKIDLKTIVNGIEKDINDLAGRVKALEDSLGKNIDAANASGTAYARIAKNAADIKDLQDNLQGNIDDSIGELNFGPLSVGAGETVNVVKQENGKINVTKQAIEITASQVSDFANAVNDLVGGTLDGLDATETDSDKGVSVTVSQLNGLITGIDVAVDETVAHIADLEELDFNSDNVDLNSPAGVEYLEMISKVTQEDGQVGAVKQKLAFATAYNAVDNKIATEADVEAIAGDLLKEINGSMHLVGVSTTDPLGTNGPTVAGVTKYSAGDIVLYTADGITTEYVYVNSAWYKLGDESIASKLVDELNSTKSDSDKGVSVTVVQKNGFIDSVDVAVDATVAHKSDIEALDSTKSDSDKGVSVTVTQEDGLITGVDVAVDETVAHMSDIEELNFGPLDLAPSETVDIVKQENGKITATKQSIAITHAQVTDFDDGVNEIIAGLDSEKSGSDKGVSVTVTEVDGLISNVSVAVDATVAHISDIEELDSVVDALSAKASAQAAGSYKVLTKIVEEDGVLVQETSESLAISNLAVSGDVKDLTQTAGTYIIFDCGSASTVID